MVGAFSLQAMALVGAELLAAVSAEGLGGAGDDLILGGLRAIAVPGGLVFGVLVAAVVGSKFAYRTFERRCWPATRSLRFAGYQLAVAGVLAVAGGGAEAASGHGGGPAPGRRRHRRRGVLERPAHQAALAAPGRRPPVRPAGRRRRWSCGAPWPAWSPPSPTACWAHCPALEPAPATAGPSTPPPPASPARHIDSTPRAALVVVLALRGRLWAASPSTPAGRSATEPEEPDAAHGGGGAVQLLGADRRGGPRPGRAAPGRPGRRPDRAPGSRRRRRRRLRPADARAQPRLRPAGRAGAGLDGGRHPPGGGRRPPRRSPATRWSSAGTARSCWARWPPPATATAGSGC